MDFFVGDQSDFKGSILCLCEFCEQKGPSVIECFPSVPASLSSLLDSFALRVLSVDVSNRKELKSADDVLVSDSHSVIDVPDLNAYAFVYNFCLTDISARGSTRPLIIALITKSSTLLMLHHREVLSHLSSLANSLRLSSSLTLLSDVLSSNLSLFYNISLLLQSSTNSSVSNEPAPTSPNVMSVIKSDEFVSLKRTINSLTKMAKLSLDIYILLLNDLNVLFDKFPCTFPDSHDVMIAMELIERLCALSESRIPVVSDLEVNSFLDYFKVSDLSISINQDLIKPFTTEQIINKPIQIEFRRIPEVTHHVYPFIFNKNNSSYLLGPFDSPRLGELLLPFDLSPSKCLDQSQHSPNPNPNPGLNYFLIGNVFQTPSPVSFNHNVSRSFKFFPPPPPPRMDSEAISPSTLDLEDTNSNLPSEYESPSEVYHSCGSNDSPNEIGFSNTKRHSFAYSDSFRPSRAPSSCSNGSMDASLFHSASFYQTPPDPSSKAVNFDLVDLEKTPKSGPEIPKLLKFCPADFQRPRLQLLCSNWQILQKLPIDKTFSLPQVAFKCSDIVHPLPSLGDAGKNSRLYFSKFSFYSHLAYTILIGRPLVLLSSRTFLEAAFRLANSLLIFSQVPPSHSINFIPSVSEARRYLSKREFSCITIVPPSAVVLPKDNRVSTRDRSFSLTEPLDHDRAVFISDSASTLYVDKLMLASSVKGKATKNGSKQWIAELPVYRGVEYLKKVGKFDEKRQNHYCLVDLFSSLSRVYTSDPSFITAVHAHLSIFATKASIFLNLFRSALLVPPVLSTKKLTFGGDEKGSEKGSMLSSIFRRRSSVSYNHKTVPNQVKKDKNLTESRRNSLPVETVSSSSDDMTLLHYSQIVDEIIEMLNVSRHGSDRNILLHFALSLSAHDSCLKLHKFLHSECVSSVYVPKGS
ncbi:hypothetical protein P9112_012697 [Eukaryota sp. TZLM1-RC]